MLAAALVLGAALWHYRLYPAFETPLAATLVLLLYGGFYTVAMYAVASTGAPLVDGNLMQLDAAMGIHLPSIVEWTAAHPTLKLLLEIAYASVALQTALVIIFCKNPWTFIYQFILGSLVCLWVFFFLPAVGPFASYGYGASETQDVYMAHLFGLRNGTMHLCCRSAQGLITAPSFHTIWAVILIAASRGWVRPFAIILNLAVIAATLTTGWHYGADVVAGLLVALLVIITYKD
jgi:hypothetical protein